MSPWQKRSCLQLQTGSHSNCRGSASCFSAAAFKLTDLWMEFGTVSPQDISAVRFNEQAPTERGHTCVNEPGSRWRHEVPRFRGGDKHKPEQTAVGVVCQEISLHLLLSYSASYLSLTSCLLLSPHRNYSTSDLFGFHPDRTLLTDYYSAVILLNICFIHNSFVFSKQGTFLMSNWSVVACLKQLDIFWSQQSATVLRSWKWINVWVLFF